MSFHSIELGNEKEKTEKKDVGLKDKTLEQYAKLLSDNADKLIAIRAALVKPLQQGKWNKYLEELSQKWEKERQEYNKMAREFKENVKKRFGKDIPIVIVQSKDKKKATVIEGFSDIGLGYIQYALIIGGAIAAIGVAAAGAWAVKGISQAYMQHKRISDIDNEVMKAIKKLPPEQQVKYLSTMSKAKEEVQLTPKAEEKGVVQRIKGAFEGLSKGTIAILALAGVGVVATLGYNLYKNRRI